jgi:hypothetical protein
LSAATQVSILDRTSGGASIAMSHGVARAAAGTIHHAITSRAHFINRFGGRLARFSSAVGAGGMLLSFGTFDTTAAQVAIEFDTEQLFLGHHWLGSGWADRFYVNAAP